MPDISSTQYDVIVIGSGGAALTGALVAAKGGLRTLVLEKSSLLGGTSAYSGSCLWLPGNEVLLRGGVPDTVERGIEYLHATVGERTPKELQEAYVRTAPALVSFLSDDPHLDFEVLPFPDYYDAPGRSRPYGRGICPTPLPSSELGDLLPLLRPTVAADQFGLEVDRTVLVGGQALIGRLLLALRATGIVDVWTDSPMVALTTRADGGVDGVRAVHEGAEMQLRSRHGVLLAAGGYECDPARRRELQHLPGADWTSAAPGTNTGDALDAARSVGADIDLLEEAWWCPATLFPNGHAAFTLGLDGGIFVNSAGRRFANESKPYDQMGHELIANREAMEGADEVWFVFDARFETMPAIVSPGVDRESFEAAGLWRSASSLEGLAQALGVSAAELTETVLRFNGFAATGVDDDFHRGEDDYDRFFASGSGPNPCLVPLDTPPFSAVRIVLGDLGTKGGARISVDGAVVDLEGTPIGGLYAAGNSAASLAGHVYPGPGVPLGSGMVMAFRAVQSVTDDVHSAS